MTNKQKEISQKKRDNFRALMADYKNGGGPFIMIDLQQLYPEWDGGGYAEPPESADTAATLIQDAVSYEVRNAFRNKIHRVCEDLATNYVHTKLNEEIQRRMDVFFKNGFMKTVKNKETGEEEEIQQISVEHHMNNILDSWFTRQPSRGLSPRTNRPLSPASMDSLHDYCGEKVVKFLKEETEKVIQDVNSEVLSEAKKSISSTVSEQLFSGLNLLPKIGGINQS